jgi:hypothetical protein
MLVLLFYTEVSYLLLKTDIELLRFGSRSAEFWLLTYLSTQRKVFGFRIWFSIKNWTITCFTFLSVI